MENLDEENKTEKVHHEHNHEHHHCADCHGEHKHEHSHEHGEEGGELPLGALIFAAALYVLALIIEHLPLTDWFPFITEQIHEGIIICLHCVAYIICGKNVLISAVRNILKGDFLDEQFLMAISSIGAICLGKFEEATAIMVLYQVGEKFEDFAVDKSRNSIEEISKLRPDKAYVKADSVDESAKTAADTVKNAETTEKTDKLLVKSPEEVEVGSVIIVKPGDRIPIDGVVVDGESFVDTSALTGESLPRRVAVGDEVLSGSINKQGVLEIRTTKNADNSALSRILDLVENATENKTRAEQFVTRFAKIYTPIVVGAAAFLAVVPGLFTGFISGNWGWQSTWSVWVYRALMFLVVSCPCALVISIPLSFSGGITACAKKGILIKGSCYLDALARTKTAVFDKTGTLTKGNFVVTHIHSLDGSITEAELLALATHTEMFSNHPISASLKAAHHDKCCDKVKLENVEEITSEGIKAVVDGKEVLAGNSKLMNDFNIQFEECAEHSDGTVVHVACNGKYAGHIVISDEIKEDSAVAIESLKACGVKNVIMLTGDNEKAAYTVAEKLGLHKAYSQLLSSDKLAKVEELLAELKKENPNENRRGTLIFAGDGVNDAPVLARADAGISMGAMGSDAAIEASDIIIMEDKPSKIAEGIKLSRRTLRIVHENIYGSIGIKALILICSAFGISTMWMAVFGDVGVTILAVLNSLRMFGVRKEK